MDNTRLIHEKCLVLASDKYMYTQAQLTEKEGITDFGPLI